MLQHRMCENLEFDQQCIINERIKSAQLNVKTLKVQFQTQSALLTLCKLKQNKLQKHHSNFSV